MILRAARWGWPIIFFVPLTLVAKRGCEFPGVDAAYHATMWLHESLPLLFFLAGIISVGAVTIRVAGARDKAATLFSLATTMPPMIAFAFEAESSRLGMVPPRVAYLDVATPLCFALVGLRPAVVLSRGFVQDLDETETRMVIRHELLHVKHRDPALGFGWHVAFAALLLPAFWGLEHWLASQRELRTNLEAAEDEPTRYAALLRSRARNQRDICVEAFGRGDRPKSLVAALAQPVIVVIVLIALAYSHTWFLGRLAYLANHHC